MTPTGLFSETEMSIKALDNSFFSMRFSPPSMANPAGLAFVDRAFQYGVSFASLTWASPIPNTQLPIKKSIIFRLKPVNPWSFLPIS